MIVLPLVRSCRVFNSSSFVLVFSHRFSSVRQSPLKIVGARLGKSKLTEGLPLTDQPECYTLPRWRSYSRTLGDVTVVHEYDQEKVRHPSGDGPRHNLLNRDRARISASPRL